MSTGRERPGWWCPISGWRLMSAAGCSSALPASCVGGGVCPPAPPGQSCSYPKAGQACFAVLADFSSSTAVTTSHRHLALSLLGVHVGCSLRSPWGTNCCIAPVSQHARSCPGRLRHQAGEVPPSGQRCGGTHPGSCLHCNTPESFLPRPSI